MPQATPARSSRRAPALIALAGGGFGIGATELTAMSLLPELARDLLASDYAVAPAHALGSMSWFVTVYAIGVVIGAPTLAVLTARLSHRTALLGFAAAFSVFTLATALAPTFGIALALRLLAALPHGAYFGLAPLVAAEMFGPGARGRGISTVLLGFTLANLAGVPLITALGHHTSWRVAYAAIGALFALTLALLWRTLPRTPGDPHRSPRHELAIFGRARVWWGTLSAALALAGFFAMYSYISPLLTREAGLPLGAVAWVLAALGVGMTLGNVLGGRLADHRPLATVGWLLPVYALTFLGTALCADRPAVMLVCVVLSGLVSSAFVPSLQVWLMDCAHGAPALGGALVHSAFNIGNALGAFLGGTVVTAGLGFRAPSLAAAATAGCAWLLLLALRATLFRRR